MPFVPMVIFKLLAQFSVDYLVHSNVSTLILFWDNLLHLLSMWFNTAILLSCLFSLWHSKSLWRCFLVFTPCDFFRTNFKWWTFWGVWVTARVLRSRGFFLGLLQSQQWWSRYCIDYLSDYKMFQDLLFFFLIPEGYYYQLKISKQFRNMPC